MSIIKCVFVLFLICYTNASRSQAPLIKNVFRDGLHLEGPHWSDTEKALYWVDIELQKVHRLSQSGNITTRSISYGPVSLAVTVKDCPKTLLVTVRSELYLMNWIKFQGDRDLRLLSAVDLGSPDNRCNDGKVDSQGRLWFGTMGKEVNNVVEEDVATLYMLDQYNYVEPEPKIRPVSISNGIAWTSDSKFMFYIDTVTRNVDVLDFHAEKGTISNRRTLFSFQANNVTGSPDGMTIDSNGNLWVACYNGGKVIKIDSRAGKLLEQHPIPASKVTSVMWGGHDMSILYVTTSKRDLSAAELALQPEAGSLFAIEGTGAKGLPENQFIFPNANTY